MSLWHEIKKYYTKTSGIGFNDGERRLPGGVSGNQSARRGCLDGENFTKGRMVMDQRNVDVLHVGLRSRADGTERYFVYPHSRWRNKSGPMWSMPCRKIEIGRAGASQPIERAASSYLRDEWGLDGVHNGRFRKLPTTTVSICSPTCGVPTVYRIHGLIVDIDFPEADALRRKFRGKWVTCEEGLHDVQASPTARAVFKVISQLEEFPGVSSTHEDSVDPISALAPELPSWHPHCLHPSGPAALRREIPAYRNAPNRVAGMLNCALVGLGWNVRHRLIKHVPQYRGRLNVIGYDVRPPSWETHGMQHSVVRDPDDLTAQIRLQQAQIVLVETTDDQHLPIIRAALNAQARLVLCEKCVAPTVDEAVDFLPLVRAARPRQQVYIIDHYLLFNQVLALYRLTPLWLGRVTRLEVKLYESAGVPPEQVHSHSAGMAGFIHHAVALAGLWFDLEQLEPVWAVHVRHPSAAVPDTYRAARFRDRNSGQIVLEAAVGKYLNQPRKIIRIEGTKGWAQVDRDQNRLIVRGVNGLNVTIRDNQYDSGYGELFDCLAMGRPLPPTLLTYERAMRVLRLVEEASAISELLPSYPIS